MDEIWKKYSADFNAMTDEEIEFEVRLAHEVIDAETSWLKAVASWKAAGKPRSKS